MECGGKRQRHAALAEHCAPAANHLTNLSTCPPKERRNPSAVSMGRQFVREHRQALARHVIGDQISPLLERWASTAFWSLAKGAGRPVRQERDGTSLLLNPLRRLSSKERRNPSAVSMVRTIC